MSQTIVYSSESDDEPEIAPPPQKERKARAPLSEEQKTALRERLAKAREAKKMKRMPKEEVLPIEEPKAEEPKVEEKKVKLTKEKTTKKKVVKEEPKVEEPVVKPKRKYVRKPKVTIPFNPF